MDIDSVALISSSSLTVETFLAEATALGIRVPNILELNRELLKEHGQKQVLQDENFNLSAYTKNLIRKIHLKELSLTKLLFFFRLKIQMFLEKAVSSSNGKPSENGNEVSRPVVALIVEAGKFTILRFFSTSIMLSKNLSF